MTRDDLVIGSICSILLAHWKDEQFDQLGCANWLENLAQTMRRYPVKIEGYLKEAIERSVEP